MYKNIKTKLKNYKTVSDSNDKMKKSFASIIIIGFVLFYFLYEYTAKYISNNTKIQTDENDTDNKILDKTRDDFYKNINYMYRMKYLLFFMFLLLIVLLYNDNPNYLYVFIYICFELLYFYYIKFSINNMILFYIIYGIFFILLNFIDKELKKYFPIWEVLLIIFIIYVTIKSFIGNSLNDNDLDDDDFD